MTSYQISNLSDPQYVCMHLSATILHRLLLAHFLHVSVPWSLKKCVPVAKLELFHVLQCPKSPQGYTVLSGPDVFFFHVYTVTQFSHPFMA